MNPQKSLTLLIYTFGPRIFLRFLEQKGVRNRSEHSVGADEEDDGVNKRNGNNLVECGCCSNNVDATCCCCCCCCCCCSLDHPGITTCSRQLHIPLLPTLFGTTKAVVVDWNERMIDIDITTKNENRSLAYCCGRQ